jgi:hypothetical protein
VTNGLEMIFFWPARDLAVAAADLLEGLALDQLVAILLPKHRDVGRIGLNDRVVLPTQSSRIVPRTLSRLMRLSSLTFGSFSLMEDLGDAEVLVHDRDVVVVVDARLHEGVAVFSAASSALSDGALPARSRRA